MWKISINCVSKIGNTFVSHINNAQKSKSAKIVYRKRATPENLNSTTRTKTFKCWKSATLDWRKSTTLCYRKLTITECYKSTTLVSWESVRILKISNIWAPIDCRKLEIFECWRSVTFKRLKSGWNKCLKSPTIECWRLVTFVFGNVPLFDCRNSETLKCWKQTLLECRKFDCWISPTFTCPKSAMLDCQESPTTEYRNLQRSCIENSIVRVLKIGIILGLKIIILIVKNKQNLSIENHKRSDWFT